VQKSERSGSCGEAQKDNNIDEEYMVDIGHISKKFSPLEEQQ
jgi:hypothetical protein